MRFSVKLFQLFLLYLFCVNVNFAAEDYSGILPESMKKDILFYAGGDKSSVRNKNIKTFNGTIVDGKYGKGILFEQRTENLFKSPEFVNPDMWILIGNKRKLWQLGRGVKHSSCVMVDNSNYVRQVLEFTAGREYTLSFYAKGEADKNLTLKIKLDDKELYSGKVEAKYKRYYFSFIPERELSTISIVGAGESGILVDNVQLECGQTYPTSFMKKKRGVERLAIDLEKINFNSKSASVAMWVKPKWIGESTRSGKCLFVVYNKRKSKISEYIRCIAFPRKGYKENDWRNRIRLSRRINKHRTMENVSIQGLLLEKMKEKEKSDWYHICASWKKDSPRSWIELYINGKKISRQEFIWSNAKDFQTFVFGYVAGGYADAVLDEMYIFNRSLKLKEVQKLYLMEK
jgi:hypothetical protein